MTHVKSCNAPRYDFYMHVVPIVTKVVTSWCNKNIIVVVNMDIKSGRLNMDIKSVTISHDCMNIWLNNNSYVHTNHQHSTPTFFNTCLHHQVVINSMQEFNNVIQYMQSPQSTFIMYKFNTSTTKNIFIVL